ncbi:protein kinase C delta type-like, partial [Spea bombifrons]|uniref:protein kinase C delta type-like n=1 Tax=Spea bombifrons TaxID=233779 RepID=UPI00234BE260
MKKEEERGRGPNKAIKPLYLLKERRILEMARESPFLCHGYAGFQTETCVLFMMEYMAGGSLQSYMKRVGRLPETTAAFYSAEIICGIQFLHARGVIHRDLKPDNILLDGEGHAKICDFGIVAEGIFGGAETKGHCGTFTYMAPEIHLKQAYGVAVDWWSFGVILFRMLNGRLPFYHGNCKKAALGSIVNRSPRYVKDLSEDAADILKHLLMKDPQHRLWITGFIRRHPFF